MTNKDIYTTATLNEIFTEVARRAQEGYIVADGPTYAEGTYTVRFKHKNGPADAQPEVVSPVKPDMPSPATETPAPLPIKHTDNKAQRGPKPKKAVETN